MLPRKTVSAMSPASARLKPLAAILVVASRTGSPAFQVPSMSSVMASPSASAIAALVAMMPEAPPVALKVMRRSGRVQNVFCSSAAAPETSRAEKLLSSDEVGDVREPFQASPRSLPKASASRAFLTVVWPPGAGKSTLSLPEESAIRASSVSLCRKLSGLSRQTPSARARRWRRSR